MQCSEKQQRPLDNRCYWLLLIITAANVNPHNRCCYMHSSYPSQHINKSTCCLIMSLWGIIHDLKLLKLMHSKGLKQIRASSKGGASTFRSCLITLFCNISTQQWKSAVVTELNTTVRNVRLYNNQRPAAVSLQRFLYISRTKRHFCRIGLAEHKCTIWTGSSNYPNPRRSSSFCRCFSN